MLADAYGYSPPIGPFSTATQALDALAETIGGNVDTSPGPGYRSAPNQTLLFDRDGRRYGLANISPREGGLFAAFNRFCLPATAR